MKIAIVGAGGRMGSWFVNYFASKDFSIMAYDLNRQSLNFHSSAVAVAMDLTSCVRDVDVVLICVPVRETPAIITQCSRNMKSGATLGEISSVKHTTHRALTKIRKDLRPLCIHPMFGPGATELKQQKILLVPVRNKSDELRHTADLFGDAKLITLRSARVHDEAIGIVLGLTYFTNLVLATMMPGKDLRLIEKIAGTTFRLQSTIAESILTDDPELIVSLIGDNPYALMHIRHYLKQARTIAQLASEDRERLLQETKRLMARMKSRSDLQKSYKSLYKMVKTMDG